MKTCVRLKLQSLIREARQGSEDIDRLRMQPDSRRVMAERLAQRFRQLIEDALPHELVEVEQVLGMRPLTLIEQLYASLKIDGRI